MPAVPSDTVVIRSIVVGRPRPPLSLLLRRPPCPRLRLPRPLLLPRLPQLCRSSSSQPAFSSSSPYIGNLTVCQFAFSGSNSGVAGLGSSTVVQSGFFVYDAASSRLNVSTASGYRLGYQLLIFNGTRVLTQSAVSGLTLGTNTVSTYLAAVGADTTTTNNNLVFVDAAPYVSDYVSGSYAGGVAFNNIAVSSTLGQGSNLGTGATTIYHTGSQYCDDATTQYCGTFAVSSCQPYPATQSSSGVSSSAASSSAQSSSSSAAVSSSATPSSSSSSSAAAAVPSSSSQPAFSSSSPYIGNLTVCQFAFSGSNSGVAGLGSSTVVQSGFFVYDAASSRLNVSTASGYRLGYQLLIFNGTRVLTQSAVSGLTLGTNTVSTYLAAVGADTTTTNNNLVFVDAAPYVSDYVSGSYAGGVGVQQHRGSHRPSDKARTSVRVRPPSSHTGSQYCDDATTQYCGTFAVSSCQPYPATQSSSGVSSSAASSSAQSSSSSAAVSSSATPSSSSSSSAAAAVPSSSSQPAFSSSSPYIGNLTVVSVCFQWQQQWCGGPRLVHRGAVGLLRLRRCIEPPQCVHCQWLSTRLSAVDIQWYTRADPVRCKWSHTRHQHGLYLPGCPSVRTLPPPTTTWCVRGCCPVRVGLRLRLVCRWCGVQQHRSGLIDPRTRLEPRYGCDHHLSHRLSVLR